MNSTVAISDSGHDLRHVVENALRESGLDLTSPLGAGGDGTETAVVVFGLQAMIESIAQLNRAQTVPARGRHLIMFERGEGLLYPQMRLRKRQLELHIQSAALQSAPAFSVNAIILENGALDERLNRDIAATVRFIVSTSAMTGQAFLLG